MDIVNTYNNIEKVRIIIGKIEPKKSSLQKPMKTITLIGTDVNTIYEKIIKLINEEIKNEKGNTD